jgi:hypothetical protein
MIDKFSQEILCSQLVNRIFELYSLNKNFKVSDLKFSIDDEIYTFPVYFSEVEINNDIKFFTMFINIKIESQDLKILLCGFSEKEIFIILSDLENELNFGNKNILLFFNKFILTTIEQQLNLSLLIEQIYDRGLIWKSGKNYETYLTIVRNFLEN